jgi:hypothetical protein
LQIAFLSVQSPAAVGLHQSVAMATRSTWWFVPVLVIVLILPADLTSEVEHDSYRVASFCTPAVPGAGPPITVTTGDELQQALDRAVGGETILLAAGATFRPTAPGGSFILRNRRIPEGQWITVRSAHRAFDAGGTVPAGTRVDRSNQSQMPRIRAVATNTAAIRAEPGARGYRLVGLDIGVDPGISQLTNLIELGSDRDIAVETQPSDIVIDRCYLHGNDAGNYRRGVALNGARLAVIDSYLENFHDANTDSQAIAGWNGPGPFKIVNNFLEAAGENIMFGGSDPEIAGLVPSDIEIRRNVSTKRLAWRSSGVPVKNAFELKNARRVLVEGNIFEHVWASGQDGTAIVLKSTNQGGRCTWCVTEYVTFRNNVVRAAAHGVVINGAEVGARGLPLPRRANHIRVQNVVFREIGGREWGGGKLFRVFGGVSDVEITHVTSTGNGSGILDPRDRDDLNPNLVFKYNIVERMYYGIGAGGDEGITTVTRNFAPYVYNQNVLVNTSGTTDQAITDAALKSRYPPITTIAPDWKAIGFLSGTEKLARTSPYYRAGDDGKDLGADLDAIAAAQEGPDSNSCSPTRPTVPPRPRPHR